MENIYAKIIAITPFEQIPDLWKNIDFHTFSEGKTLYAYQREAVQNALKLLFLFYQKQGTQETEKLKTSFLSLLRGHGLTDEAQENFVGSHRNKTAFEILTTPNKSGKDYFKVESEGDIAAHHFVNRMSFWMATGSGKSVVLIKLIELLHDLMSNDLIPQKDMLFLTHRVDLIEQLKAHISEFNKFIKVTKGIEVVVRDLKEFPEQKIKDSLFREKEIAIYCYRSDLISDVRKDAIIDFKTYENNGNWYVILDEAHKGEAEESKRKQYFNVLSRNGFLFNFSATFTEEIDKISAVYNLNLGEYIRKGFGKHLYLFQEQFKFFDINREKEDYKDEQKQKIVLMSLILLAYIKKRKELLNLTEVYHNPMLVTLVNSVSKKDSDLDLFFSELRKIAKNELAPDLFEQAKELLMTDLRGSKTEFERQAVLSETEVSFFSEITIEDVWKYVFNTNSAGELEVRRNPNNKQELSFRVKSSANSAVFALIKIGDSREFEKNNLQGFNIENDFDKKATIFENLNHSSVNILMGSRAFYEGWDSNRPNIINLINIGVGNDASKFILQSVGRGIRIEPIKNQRKRLEGLIADGIVSVTADLALNKTEVKPIETLFIFSTNFNAISRILNTLKTAQGEEEHILPMFEKFVHNFPLFIPIYKKITDKVEQESKRLKFKIHEQDFKIFDKLMKDVDKRVLALNYYLSYQDIAILTEKHSQYKSYFKETGEERLGKIELILKRILSYYKTIPEKFDTFALLKDEDIRHYQQVKVRVSENKSKNTVDFAGFEDLKKKIAKVKNPITSETREQELDELMESGKITLSEYKKEIKNLASYSETGFETFTNFQETIEIKKLQEHYYFPTIVAEKKSIEWLKHIIDTPSEIIFLRNLEKYLKESDNFFSQFDWWKFSKIDHTLDTNMRIPYTDLLSGQRNFLPDFVFWLHKGNDYHILYLDPKGTGRTEYKDKVKGYQVFFEENGKVKVFDFEGKKFRVHLRLVTDDLNKLQDDDFYKKYWIENDNFSLDF